MLVLTTKPKQRGFDYPEGMTYEIYDPLVVVPKLRVINLDGKGVYKGFSYVKGEYIPLWVIGVVAVGGFIAYKKFKK